MSNTPPLRRQYTYKMRCITYQHGPGHHRRLNSTNIDQSADRSGNADGYDVRIGHLERPNGRRLRFYRRELCDPRQLE